MHVYLKDQFVFLAASFAVGIFLSLLYDVFRVLRVSRGNRYSKGLSPEKIISKVCLLKLYNSFSKRRSDKKRNQNIEYILVLLEDILYSLLLCMTVQILVFGGNFGIPRFFSFVGIMAGFILSRITFGKVIMLTSEYIAYFIGAFLYYLLYPFYFLFLKIKKVIYKLSNMVYNRYVKVKVRKSSEKNILLIQKFISDFSKNI